MTHGTAQRYDEGCRCAQCTYARLDWDWVLYGEIFIIRQADGSIGRLDPQAVKR